MAGYDSAFDAGTGEHALYLAADVVVDATALREEFHAQGRVHAVSLQRQVYDGPVERGDLFLGRTGVVRTESWPSSAGTREVLAWILVEEDGISRYQYAVPVAEARHVDSDRVSRLVEGYLRPARAVHQADGGGAGPAGPAPSSQPWPPRVYRSGDAGRLQVWVHRPRVGPCGADAATRLDVGTDGRVVRERHFYSLTALTECEQLGEPTDGWWLGQEEPLPFGQRLTGVVDGPTGPVQIRNGDSLYTQVVAWSLGRFALAGLVAPSVSTVAFDPLDPACSRRCGLARPVPDPTVLVCVDAAGLDLSSDARPRETAPLWPSRLVLHELAHLWVDQHADASARQQVVVELDLPGWADPAGPWQEQGAEWAAESIAWGLVGRPLTASLPESPPCERLAGVFRTLTGAEPLTRCP